MTQVRQLTRAWYPADLTAMHGEATAERVETEPSLLGAGPHLLAVGRR